MNILSPLLLMIGSTVSATPPAIQSELVFPLHDQHNHAPGIVELPNGDLVVSWYRGSGERSADDVAVYGARLRNGSSAWSERLLFADTPGFPDCNTCMHVDRRGRVWLFWPVIIANSWESCLTHFKVAEGSGDVWPPVWNEHGVILLKPDDFQKDATESLPAQAPRYRLLVIPVTLLVQLGGDPGRDSTLR